MLKKRMCFMIGMAALFVVAYFIPAIVTVAEDKSLKKEAKFYTIESVDITPKESSFYKKLQDFPTMLSNRMYVGNQKSMSQEQVLMVGIEFLQLVGVEIDVDHLKYYEASVYLTTASEYEDVYFVWENILIDEHGVEYHIWIDDETEKVLGFSVADYVEVSDVGGDLQHLYVLAPQQQLADALAEYYDFASGKIEFNELYGIEMIAFYDSEGKEQMSIPISYQKADLVCNLTELPDYSVSTLDDEYDKMKN